ncbi:tRNA (adenosine(37)-N6)-threonylcarbamoyltransferase complex ATPase subunit type 1 TsaE [Georgenia subflava]|uniref:tRNA threonylcarbamoyladenosine biosynthesis protein TsaE n=1 Tax=Georgenia subflava TaxID=1622177 RepID=A0A6N7EL21_9MICO|nr:tRNA (adenosine(37)-N6)-threonylcarbamoyltransferase complex ATPase subunit type 1 TsaE [Georgenia subflava]MPV39092.1 tRNA (adenosine(37)-N6)-threonylcarbamoyltransferase complex ATPase subunit type 1 TsaE [Georgenia subflava]
MSLTLTVPDAEAARELGRRLATVLRAGDLVLLSGDLGAGKTTLTQGIGSGLGVRGQVASPTFIIARVHPALGDGPDLVHVDAYRLGSLDEVDALDLDTSLEDSVTVVEWGTGKVEALAEDRLEIEIRRPRGEGFSAAGSELAELAAPAPREVVVEGLGARWAEVDLGRHLLAAPA